MSRIAVARELLAVARILASLQEKLKKWPPRDKRWEKIGPNIWEADSSSHSFNHAFGYSGMKWVDPWGRPLDIKKFKWREKGMDLESLADMDGIYHYDGETTLDGEKIRLVFVDGV